MIFLHELGHYLTAKWSGMKVTEFFLGFGPRIWSFHRGETEYGLKAIPAGAYVRIIGMSNLERRSRPRTSPAPTGSKSYWRRLRVAVGRARSCTSCMAFVLLFVAASSAYGQRHERPAGRSARSRGSATRARARPIEAGLEVGDRIVAVDGIAGHDVRRRRST